MGEYLAWFYEALIADAPSNLEIVRHYAAGDRHHSRDRRTRDGVAQRRFEADRRSRGADVGHTLNEERVGTWRGALLASVSR
jgi:hypothetical protein